MGVWSKAACKSGVSYAIAAMGISLEQRLSLSPE